MTEPARDEKTIFLQAFKCTSAHKQAEFLMEACGDDEDLLRRVNELLAAHDQSQGPLDSPPTEAVQPPTLDHHIAEKPGDQIGPFKLLQELGRGGMGVVYMAEQSKPVERRVALKIIKPGMDSGQVIARFEAERQALAMMDHPNIAKVLDAGATESGRPYFVMELVKGVPITEFCDEHRYSPKQRLQLFIQVCQAVQHAHQKGIIHRDLKPSNVLVAEYDHQASPKVIDFGVAKATTHKLTDKTMFTQFGQIMGTLEYMSPEQAKLNQLDIDTRSDVYSLGVLLYELLTGETPFDRKRLYSAAFDEMLKIIREEEPPKPSTRLSSAHDRASVAKHRAETPERLDKTIKGDLDWIAMKALEKDRNRRYETASSLAGDIERYLNDELIEARAPSRSYRFQKFVRRNKGPVLAISAFLISLVAGIVGTSVNWRAATVALEKADQERTRANENEQKARESEDLAKEEARRANASEVAAIREAARATAAEKFAQEEAASAKQANQRALDVFMQDGLAFAQSGDVRRTKSIIRQISAVGGTDVQIKLVEAALATARNDPRARDLLLEAYEAEPENIHTVQSLMWNYLFEGDFRNALTYAKQSQSLQPVTPYEKMLSANFMGWQNPDAVIPVYEEILEDYDSGFAHLLSALPLLSKALFDNDLSYAIRANDEATTAQVLLGNPSLAKVWRLAANDVAYYLAKKQEKPFDAYLAVADDVVRQIDFADPSQQVQQPSFRQLVATHYDFVAQDEEKAREVYVAMSRQGKLGWFRGFHGAFALKHDGAQAALNVMKSESGIDGTVNYLKAALVALTGGDQLESQRFLREIENSPDILAFVWAETAGVYALLGREEDAARLAKQFGDVPQHPFRFELAPNRLIADFFLDKISAQEVADGVKDARQKCSTHLVAAFRALGQKDRDRALGHFQLGADVCWPLHLSFHQNWCVAFLTQMEQDPQWPALAAD